jgi:dienelactone hydrolase
MPQLKGSVIGLALLITLVGLVEAAQSDVDIPMADGIVLKGTYFSPGAPGPAVLLLQQCDKDRRSWLVLATDLSRAGMHVLTVDFRGLGQSGGKPVSAEERQSLAGKWPADMDAALGFLLQQKDVDQSKIAVGGSSCGVPQAANMAMRERRIRVLLVLSGPATDDAKKYVSQTPSLAVFGGAAEQDAGQVESIKELVGLSKHAASTLKLYPGTDHGIELFTAHKDLQPLVVSWVKTQFQ